MERHILPGTGRHATRIERESAGMSHRDPSFYRPLGGRGLLRTLTHKAAFFFRRKRLRNMIRYAPYEIRRNGVSCQALSLPVYPL